MLSSVASDSSARQHATVRTPSSRRRPRLRGGRGRRHQGRIRRVAPAQGREPRRLPRERGRHLLHQDDVSIAIGAEKELEKGITKSQGVTKNFR